MKITAPFRGRRAAKKLDLTDMKHAFRDTRLWCAIGVVSAPDDGGPHFEVLGDDVHVEVVLQPSLTPVTCRLTGGTWRIPALGEEVIVAIPEGAIEFMPILIAPLSSGSVPTGQGPALGRVVVEAGEVTVHDGAGGAVSLALKSDVDSTNSVLGSHTHPFVAKSGPDALTTAPTAAAITAATGTTVLKGK